MEVPSDTTKPGKNGRLNTKKNRNKNLYFMFVD